MAMMAAGARTARPAVQLAHVGGVAELAELAVAAEQAGFERVVVAETNGPDPLVALAVIAERTGLAVGTSILGVMARTAPTMAMAAADLATLTGKPVHLGIGIGGQAIVERWHGQPFDHPATRVEDTLTILRQALGGARTDHDGLRRSHGFRLDQEPGAPVRLYVGGMGPRMLDVAARRADGLILTWVPPRVVAERRHRLDDALRRAGRRVGDARLVARVYVAVEDDPGRLARMRDLVARELTEYIASPPYGEYFRAIGYGEETAAVQAAFAAGDRAASRRGVSDAMLDEMLVAGSNEECVARIAEYTAVGADEIIVQLVSAARGGDPSTTLRALGAAYQQEGALVL